ncbi:MAG: hypothetical protein U1C74_18580, partial [Phenylobacterium sp.]|nr:hypothetical protein [Phenylobacterium sp.]
MQRIFRLISRADDVKAGSGHFDELFTDGERFRIGELAVEVLQRRPWLMISVKPRGGPANGEEVAHAASFPPPGGRKAMSTSPAVASRANRAPVRKVASGPIRDHSKPATLLAASVVAGA